MDATESLRDLPALQETCLLPAPVVGARRPYTAILAAGLSPPDGDEALGCNDRGGEASRAPPLPHLALLEWPHCNKQGRQLLCDSE